jgi:prepilin-type N-terminal cleavage/methylation domain-containing protein
LIARIRAALRHGERGLTLVELLVAMSIGVIIIGAVGGLFAASIKAAKTDQTSESAIRQGSNMMNAMTQYVHAATLLPKSDGSYVSAIEKSLPTDVAFYAYVNLTNGTVQQPVQVEFYRDTTTGLLMEKQWDGVADSNGFYTFAALTSAPSRTFTLGGPLASPNSDGLNLFVYLDANGNQIANPTANLGAIRAIQVNMEAGSTTAGKAGNTHIQNTLYLFNVGYTTSTASASPSS